MDFSVSILAGAQVDHILDDESFLAAWVRLSSVDKKLTVIQEHPFVITWYNEYRAIYTPILCIGRNNASEIVGIMPLAKKDANGAITHAGDYQAEYHGWICLPALDEAFPIACIIEIKRMFKPKIWEWRWLPPGAPFRWLNSTLLTSQGIYAKFRMQDSPVLHLSDGEALGKIHKNRSIRNKINRLKRSGDFHLERITDKKKTQELLPLLSSQCDFRQGAVHNVMPFSDDPMKAHFYAERQNYPDSNHFTVLWSKGKAVAFHFGACNAQTVLLGLITHDPLSSKNSPGTILLSQLASMLASEGFTSFDLTPGGDEYKERFSNAHQTLYLPTFLFSRRAKIRLDLQEKTRQAAKRLLSVFLTNEDAMRRLRDDLRDRLAAAGGMTLKRMFCKMAEIAWRRREHLYYRLTVHGAEKMPQKDPDVHVQQYEDLLRCKIPDDSRSRQKFLSYAMKRMHCGDRFYSITRDGTLAQCVWVAQGEYEGWNRSPNRSALPFQADEPTAILHSFHTESGSDRQELCMKIIRQAVSDIGSTGPMNIYCSVGSEDLPLRKALEALGFSPCFRVTEIRLGLWSRKTEHFLA